MLFSTLTSLEIFYIFSLSLFIDPLAFPGNCLISIYLLTCPNFLLTSCFISFLSVKVFWSRFVAWLLFFCAIKVWLQVYACHMKKWRPKTMCRGRSLFSLSLWASETELRLWGFLGKHSYQVKPSHWPYRYNVNQIQFVKIYFVLSIMCSKERYMSTSKESILYCFGMMSYTFQSVAQVQCWSLDSLLDD